MFKKILACLDGSHLAEQILPYAAEEASKLNGKLILLNVFHAYEAEPKGFSSKAGGLPAPHTYDEPPPIRIPQEDQAKAYLERIAEPLRKKGVDVDCVTIEAPPGDTGNAIVRYAKNHNVDLITIATHGQGGLRHLVFGSVAESVMRESHLPVLMLRPTETKG
jgi:nucleotide-binding universal stress UspA family protein